MNRYDSIVDEVMKETIRMMVEGKDKYGEGCVGDAYIDWGDSSWKNCDFQRVAVDVANIFAEKGFFLYKDYEYNKNVHKNVFVAIRIHYNPWPYNNREEYYGGAANSRYMAKYSDMIDKACQDIDKFYEGIKQKKREERALKEQQKLDKIANNRKDKTKSDKYIYLISFVYRGDTCVDYIKGEFNLLKIEGNTSNSGFSTPNAKDAKVYETKAAAQKVVDSLNKCWITNKLMRNIKVVHKPRKMLEE